MPYLPGTIVGVAILLVAFVLILGLVNMLRGGSPSRSQQLMRWRVGLQFVAILAIVVALYLSETLMVRLNKIYTRTGDAGETGLGDGERRPKYDARVAAYGEVDELNCVIGLARLQTGAADPDLPASTRRWRGCRTICSISAPISACPRAAGRVPARCA